MPTIQYLTYGQIDKKKWDACIHTAENGLIYGYSYYLDAMAKQWHALVLDDYEMVMPLTWNKKFGIYYLYQPAFTASLGIFGKSVTAASVEDFLHSIPKKFSYWDIYLNYRNFFQLPGFNLYDRVNYILPLNDSYDNLYNRYNDNCKRNIKKSEVSKNLIQKDIDVAGVIALAKAQLQHFRSPAHRDFEQFGKLYAHLYEKEKATTYGIYAETGQLIASAVFFFSHNRAYYILVGNHPNGKISGASHALINAFIRDHAGQNMILDFEGSDISNLAFFYKGFGAGEEKFSAIKLNRLPFYLRWMKG